jgi:hypothetical protein
LPGFPLIRPGFESLLLLFQQLDDSPLMGLMMIEFDPERVTLLSQEYFIEKEDNRVECMCLPHA